MKIDTTISNNKPVKYHKEKQSRTSIKINGKLMIYMHCYGNNFKQINTKNTKLIPSKHIPVCTKQKIIVTQINQFTNLTIK